ncbi:MAG TPA: DUF4286 family protein [Saprospiraceae bacterium]|nr:DUF4286 family protein [Saprospiraceae bacterium]
MVIYNVTVKIDSGLADEWIHWMRSHHVPRVLSTGYFHKCRISKLELEETDGQTYVLQYDALSRDALQQYMIHSAPALQKEHIERYANRFVAFRTILEVLEELYPIERQS